MPRRSVAAGRHGTRSATHRERHDGDRRVREQQRRDGATGVVGDVGAFESQLVYAMRWVIEQRLRHGRDAVIAQRPQLWRARASVSASHSDMATTGRTRRFNAVTFDLKISERRSASDMMVDAGVWQLRCNDDDTTTMLAREHESEVVVVCCLAVARCCCCPQLQPQAQLLSPSLQLAPRAASSSPLVPWLRIMNQEQTEEIEALEAIFMDDLVGTRACSPAMWRLASPRHYDSYSK